MANEASFLGRGWGFPPTFGAGGGDVEMVSGEDDIRSNLAVLLMTSPGERVMREAFGTDLSRLMFAELDAGLSGAVQRVIQDAVAAHEPRIKVDKVEVEGMKDDPQGLLIHLHYTVEATNSRFNMVFPFYRMEAGLPGA